MINSNAFILRVRDKHSQILYIISTKMTQYKLSCKKSEVVRSFSHRKIASVVLYKEQSIDNASFEITSK